MTVCVTAWPRREFHDEACFRESVRCFAGWVGHYRLMVRWVRFAGARLAGFFAKDELATSVPVFARDPIAAAIEAISTVGRRTGICSN
jgi:hypothetical protein